MSLVQVQQEEPNKKARKQLRAFLRYKILFMKYLFLFSKLVVCIALIGNLAFWSLSRLHRQLEENL